MRDECAWCHNTQTCLPFSDYFTSYVYGQCTSWADNISLSHHCHQCELFTDCKKCLAHYGCGWCWNEDNPTIGRCISGDFTGPDSADNCSALISEVRNVSASETSSWTYHQCPNVDECGLGLHDCPEHSECNNLPNSFDCQCVRGYEEDLHGKCVKTCYYDCKHGNCSESPDYVCLCERGWTGDDCNTDCGCNHHSTCQTGVGVCDACQDGTTGDQCQFCQTGTFGDPQSPAGCVPCNCNGHGSVSHGQCNNETGECHCTDNTEGDHCEFCQPGYYGDPSNGGQCYLQCDDRTVLTSVRRGGLGTWRGRGIVGVSHAYCLWLVTVLSHLAPARSPAAAPAVSPQRIRITIEGDLQVQCGKHYVYVYDGVPSFINGSSPDTDHSVLLGAICGNRPSTDLVMLASSGIVTVYFEVDMRDRLSTGFNATYEVLDCQTGGSCECEAGFKGLNCDVPLCPLNCSQHLDQGSCNRLTGRCQCETGYYGEGCEKVVESDLPYLVPLVDPATWTGYIWDIPPPRVGHTLTSCGEGELFLFGGYSVQKGLHSDTWVFDVAKQRWDNVIPLDQEPSGRYYHAAACIPSLKLIYVFGGLVQKGPGRKFAPTNELWKFNYESKVWTNESVPSWLPALAGHTLTHVGDTKLVLIGGISDANYFSDKVFEYDARRGFLAWQEYGPANLSGTALTGVYGHSGVYYDHQKTIYVYGGYVFRDTRWQVSNHLFAFDVPNRQWNLLTPEKLSDFEERVFHVAVGLHDEMAVLGGWRENHSYAPDILIYKYTCNTWHRVTLPDGYVGKELISAIGLGAAGDQGRVFVFGGYAGETRGMLLEVRLPKDVCALIQDLQVCSNISGCSLCSNSKDNAYVCQATVSRDGASVLQGCRSKHGLQSSKPCNYDWHANRDCYRYTSCSQCLAVYPNFREASPACKWCTKCTKNAPGRCIPRGRDCDCKSQPDVEEVEDCLEIRCSASTCERCVARNTCAWTQNFKPSTETSKFWIEEPVYDWSCVTMATFKSEESEVEPCKEPCHSFSSCASCLASSGGEGGSQSCAWSETLKECMAPAYVPLRCSYGECGVLMERPKGVSVAAVCPQQCIMNTKCADCVTKPGCGWCAFGGLNGMGLCMLGGLAGPTHGVCTEQNITTAREAPAEPDVSLDMSSLATILETAENNMRGASGSPTWSFGQCPPENECTNSHHTCDSQTQVCVDTPTYFKCPCKDGYIQTQVGACKPVCHQGCSKHGTCVRPDKCQCHFGYVGDNCSVECLCNKHSNCKSATETDNCLECMNNTMGARCEHCKPLFVGDPRNGKRCIPCSEFCNNHTDICILRSHYEDMESLNLKEIVRRAYKMPKSEYGPKEEEAVCVECGQNTRGERCDSCLEGHFRLAKHPSTQPCMKCQCNGHSDTCQERTGEHCQCRNNTESKCDSKDNSPPCWQIQCSTCKEYFMGKPTDGHQCYRQMTVDKDYCYDPETQKNCNSDPSPLLQGRTVFFYVQPKYLNVDIRITIDVTLGGVDVYLANKEEIFQVAVERGTGVHHINLDSQFSVVDRHTGSSVYQLSRRRRKRSITLTSAPAKVYLKDEVSANELNTFITVRHKNTILVVRQVQFRLVITLPRHYHELQNTQFFVILKSLHNITSGSLYFRQDQPHIDLFVFFSVFFSCFFLFLAVCVLLWKMKTTLDLRRSRQMRAREMQCMASRPSAKVVVLLDVKNPVTLPITTLTSRRPRPIRTSFRNLHMVDLSPQHPLPLQRDDGLGVVPVAIEPTDDGIAAVATVIMQLPGGASPPSKLCLGSTLTMRILSPVPATKGSQRHHRLSASSC